MVRGVLLAGVALSLGCFTPVGEPEYWERQRRWGDGGRIWVEPVTGSGEGCPSIACRERGSASNVRDLVGLLSDQSWTVVARSTSVCRPASDDVSVRETLAVSAPDIPLPAICSTGACTSLGFVLAPGLQGVKCLDDFCSALMLSGARFRVRLTLLDQYPMSPRYVPLVDVMPPCDRGGAKGELACTPQRTCWESELELCRFCSLRPPAECACIGHREGTDCVLYPTSDLACPGSCRAGVCELAQPACW